MRKTLETETKLELGDQDFGRLLAAGTVVKEVHQINIYFDSQWRLADRAATLRIRIATGTLPRLTLKLPVKKSASARVCKELEVNLSEGNTRQWKARTLMVRRDLPRGMADVLERFGIDELQRVGWVRNTRLVLQLGKHGTVELDRLRLPNGAVFREVEVEEGNPKARNLLVQAIRAIAPTSRPSPISKFERFRLACSSLQAPGRATS